VNLDTEQNCPTYAELQPPTVSAKTGLAEGVGCVYPRAVQTLADEVTAAGLTWKAYVQGMDPASAPGARCRHPETGAPDPNHAPTPGDPYLTLRNPFVYFHSLLDNGACASDDVDLSRLVGDLATAATTPSLSWIVPSACDDGTAAPCAPGAAAGLAAADGFLKEVVGEILATPAYREGGLIAIVPDSLPGGQSDGVNMPVGALLISPFVHAGAKVSESFNDFSLSKSLARLFGVLPLGHANDPGAVSFGATVYSTTEKAAQAASRPRGLPTSKSAAPHTGG
jgi:phosphatidylinositol-3-phosphatase